MTTSINGAFFKKDRHKHNSSFHFICLVTTDFYSKQNADIMLAKKILLLRVAYSPRTGANLIGTIRLTKKPAKGLT